MAKTHKDPNEYCIQCGYSYGHADETCVHCGFDPVDNPVDAAKQDKAESDFSAWQNSGRDGE